MGFPQDRGATLAALAQLQQMSPNEVKEARLTLGLSLDQLAILIGYDRAERSDRRKLMADIECGVLPLRPAQERLIVAYLEGYRPEDWPT